MSKQSWRQRLAESVDRDKLLAYLAKAGWKRVDEVPVRFAVHTKPCECGKCDDEYEVCVPMREARDKDRRMWEAIDTLTVVEDRGPESIVRGIMGDADHADALKYRALIAKPPACMRCQKDMALSPDGLLWRCCGESCAPIKESLTLREAARDVVNARHNFNVHAISLDEFMAYVVSLATVLEATAPTTDALRDYMKKADALTRVVVAIRTLDATRKRKHATVTEVAEDELEVEKAARTLADMHNELCEKCYGAGRVTTRSWGGPEVTGPPDTVSHSACHACNGTGKRTPKPTTPTCSECGKPMIQCSLATIGDGALVKERVWYCTDHPAAMRFVGGAQ